MVAIPIFSIVKTGLGILGRLGKGKATKTGAAILVAATAGQVGIEFAGLTEAIEAATQFVLVLIQLVGTVLTAFGVGRKAIVQSISEG